MSIIPPPHKNTPFENYSHVLIAHLGALEFIVGKLDGLSARIPLGIKKLIRTNLRSFLFLWAGQFGARRFFSLKASDTVVCLLVVALYGLDCVYRAFTNRK